MKSVSSSNPDTDARPLPPNKRICVDNSPVEVEDAVATTTSNGDAAAEAEDASTGSPTARAGSVVTDDTEVEADNNGSYTINRKILPVTLLSGFLGSGKTTLLKRILTSKTSQLKIAIIVNDMGALNIDAQTIKSHKLIQEKEAMVEMHNGCICCTLRGDLLKTVKMLAMENKYDYLVIESTGISEPLPVAQTFVMDVNGEEGGEDEDDNAEHVDDNGNEEGPQKKEGSFEPLSKYARMDTLVTVLDTYNFASILGTIESEADRDKYFGDGEVETDESDESIVQLLIDQIEFSNVILLNKIDLLKSESCSGGNSRDVESQIKGICSLLKGGMRS